MNEIKWKSVDSSEIPTKPMTLEMLIASFRVPKEFLENEQGKSYAEARLNLMRTFGRIPEIQPKSLSSFGEVE